jgi:hypothetical protein
MIVLLDFNDVLTLNIAACCQETIKKLKRTELFREMLSEEYTA